MKGPHRSRAGAPARLADAVDGRGARHVPHLVPPRPQAAAEIGVLPVQEVPLVEAVHRVQGVNFRATTAEPS